MDAFVVIDAMIFGKGVFGIFSALEKAVCFKEELEKESKYLFEIKQMTIIGSYKFPDNIFAAYNYDLLYDMHTLDGLYTDSELAAEAVGEKGLIDEFLIDLPEKQKIRIIV